MDEKFIHYHLHQRQADILRERDNDRLAKVAIEAQPASSKPKLRSLWGGWIRALLRNYYTVRPMRPSAPPSPIPARGEGE